MGFKRPNEVSGGAAWGCQGNVNFLSVLDKYDQTDRFAVGSTV